MVRSMCGVPSLDGPADLIGALVADFDNAARPSARPASAQRMPGQMGLFAARECASTAACWAC
jgi:hypothetical protein